MTLLPSDRTSHRWPETPRRAAAGRPTLTAEKAAHPPACRGRALHRQKVVVISSACCSRRRRRPGAPREQDEDRSFASDLNLDQIVAAIAGDREERDLITAVLFGHLRDADAVRYRQEVFQDLEDPALFDQVQRFAGLMHQVRAHLRQLAKMQYRYQREGWLLDAAAIYCDAVQSLAGHLASAQISSRGLLAFREYLASYVASAGFTALVSDTQGPQGRPRADPLLHPHPGRPGRREPLPG